MGDRGPASGEPRNSGDRPAHQDAASASSALQRTDVIETILPEDRRGPALELVRRMARAWRLSRRETEVLSVALIDGSRKGMAARLGISPSTARNHVHSILSKAHERDFQGLLEKLRTRLLGLGDSCEPGP